MQEENTEKRNAGHMKGHAEAVTALRAAFAAYQVWQEDAGDWGTFVDWVVYRPAREGRAKDGAMDEVTFDMRSKCRLSPDWAHDEIVRLRARVKELEANQRPPQCPASSDGYRCQREHDHAGSHTYNASGISLAWSTRRY